jgi:glycosyltransferase involved in cell wall biosynthesis
LIEFHRVELPMNHPQASPAVPRLRFLTALPVYNEVNHVTGVLDEVVRNAQDVLVVDDGSTDGTRELLAQRNDVTVISHPHNRGYGAALQTAFEYAIAHKYDVIVTIDCDGQHEPQRIAQLAAACGDADIVSGSRYLELDESTRRAPADRRRINQQVTEELNCRLGLKLTDAFCGFKAYRVEALKRLRVTEPGYAMPLELWVQAAFQGLRIIELPVPLIYLDEERSFGGALDDAAKRLAYYHSVIDRAVAACAASKPAHGAAAFPCAELFQGCS